MLKYALMCLMAMLPLQVFASNSVAHTYFALKYLENHPQYTEEEKQAFIIGTVFPDIQDLDVTLQGKTHPEVFSALCIQDEPNAFWAGLKLHCLVDDVRTEFQNSWGIFDQIQDLPVVKKGAFLKVIEDELVFKKAVDYCYARSCMCRICDEEKSIESDVEVIERWHNIVCTSLTLSQQEILDKLVMRNSGFLKHSAEEIKSWSEALPEASKREDINRYFEALLDHFDEILK